MSLYLPIRGASSLRGARIIPPDELVVRLRVDDADDDPPVAADVTAFCVAESIVVDFGSFEPIVSLIAGRRLFVALVLLPPDICIPVVADMI